MNDSDLREATWNNEDIKLNMVSMALWVANRSLSQVWKVILKSFYLNHYSLVSQANWCNMTFTVGNLFICHSCIGWPESSPTCIWTWVPRLRGGQLTNWAILLYWNLIRCVTDNCTCSWHMELMITMDRYDWLLGQLLCDLWPCQTGGHSWQVQIGRNAFGDSR